MNLYFEIEGCRETGEYIVRKIDTGTSTVIENIIGNKRNGLKQARQSIGEYLHQAGYSDDQVFTHHCIKPSRNKNPIHRWSVVKLRGGIPTENSTN